VNRVILTRVILTLTMAAGTTCLVVATSPILRAGDDNLVYADFEEVQNGRLVSARGGLIELTAYQESDPNKSTFKGLEGADPPAPEQVRLKKDDPNHLAKFDYALFAPNQHAGAAIEIHGQPDQDGKPVADDVSAYKDVSLQVFATGIQKLRVELISHGQDVEFRALPPNYQEGYPQVTFKVREGLSTYRIALKAFSQPSWVENRVDPKEILKKLTSVSLTAFCEHCTLNYKGVIALDNVVFEK
jgi:hypothetical protein